MNMYSVMMNNRFTVKIVLKYSQVSNDVHSMFHPLTRLNDEFANLIAKGYTSIL